MHSKCIRVNKLPLVLSVQSRIYIHAPLEASNVKQHFQPRLVRSRLFILYYVLGVGLRLVSVVSHTSLRHWMLKLSPSLQAAASSRACFFCVLREDSSSYMVVRLKSTLSCKYSAGSLCTRLSSWPRDSFSLPKYSRHTAALLFAWRVKREESNTFILWSTSYKQLSSFLAIDEILQLSMFHCYMVHFLFSTV